MQNNSEDSASLQIEQARKLYNYGNLPDPIYCNLVQITSKYMQILHIK